MRDQDKVSLENAYAGILGEEKLKEIKSKLVRSIQDSNIPDVDKRKIFVTINKIKTINDVQRFLNMMHQRAKEEQNTVSFGS